MAAEMVTMDDKDLSDYFLKEYRQNLLSLLRKFELTDEDYLTTSLRVLEKRRQAQQMQKVLEEKEKAFKEKMEVINQRWKALHDNNVQMKIHMEKSERILKQENKLPMQALKKASSDRLRMMQKESDLLKDKRKLDFLRNKHQKLCCKVQKYSIFNRYLEDVVKNSLFDEIQAVIWHYKTQMRMHRDMLQKREEMSEQAKVLLGQHMAEKEAEILQYEKELMELQLYLDDTQNDVFWRETCLFNIQGKIAQKTLTLGIIKMATLNLFQSVNTNPKFSLNVPLNDSHMQLNMIHEFIEILQTAR